MQNYTAPMRGYASRSLRPAKFPSHPPIRVFPQRPGAFFLLARRGGLMKGREHGTTHRSGPVLQGEGG